MQDWFILRTDSRNTLRLAQSLVSAGHEAWTPRIAITRRRPRSRARSTHYQPLIPRYVFARELPEQSLIRFSIMLAGDLPAKIHDHELEPLRTAETAVIPKRRQPSWSKGQNVRLPDGPFGGLVCQVISSARGVTRVAFGHIPLEFPTCALRADSALAA